MPSRLAISIFSLLTIGGNFAHMPAYYLPACPILSGPHPRIPVSTANEGTTYFYCQSSTQRGYDNIVPDPSQAKLFGLVLTEANHT